MNQNITFYLLGAQKCATTWLFHCLNDHPDIFIGGGKREDLYLGGEKYLEKPDNWFSSLYNNASKSQILGSASVEYINDINSLSYIKSFSHNPKFILSLRNPVERAISSYYWKIRKGLPIENNINRYFQQSIDNYGKVGENNFKENNDEIIDRGFYFKNVEKYISATSPGKFKLILYDEIESHPQKVLIDLYKFLEVSSDFKTNYLNRAFKANNYNSIWGILEGKYFSKNRLLKSLYRGVNELILMSIKNKRNLIYKSIDKRIVQKLYDIYREPNNKLIEIVDKYALPNIIQAKDIITTWNQSRI